MKNSELIKQLKALKEDVSRQTQMDKRAYDRMQNIAGIVSEGEYGDDSPVEESEEDRGYTSGGRIQTPAQAAGRRGGPLSSSEQLLFKFPKLHNAYLWAMKNIQNKDSAIKFLEKKMVGMPLNDAMKQGILDMAREKFDEKKPSGGKISLVKKPQN